MHDSGRNGSDDRSLVPRYNPTAPLPQRATGAPAFDGSREEQASLFEYWRILRRRKWILVSAGSLGLLITAGISMLQTPSYRARAALEIQGVNESFLNIKDLDPTTSSSFTAESNLLTQIQILRSESLLERVVTKVRLAEREREGKLRGRWYRWLHGTKRGAVEPVANPKALAGPAGANLTVRLIGQTRIVELIYQASAPELAADFINTLAGEYIERIQETRWNSSQQTAAWLARNLQEQKIKLENSEDQLQAYARASGLTLTSTPQSSQPDNLDEQQLRSLQEELLRAQADRVAKQSRFEAVNELAADSLSEVVDDSTLRAYQTTLTDLRRQRADLMTSLTEAHPKVVRLQAQISEMEAALAQERRKVLRTAESDYHSAQRREQLVRSAYAAQVTRVSDLTAKLVHYNLLKREVDTNRQMYDTMLQKAKEAAVTAAMRATTAVLVDAAQPPLWPYRPNLPLNMGIGLLAGLLLGTGWMLLREQADQTVRTPGEAPAFLDLPELGIIPSAELDGAAGPKRLRRASVHGLAAPAPAANGQAAIDDGRRAPPSQIEKLELVTWQQKQSLLADSYRSTMNSILFSERPGGQPRVIVITSPAPMEGKTTVATNLGIALAEIGRKVLLIDADTRRPQLHQIFALPNNRGLTNIWDDTDVFELQAMNRLVRHTEVPGLYVIPSGPRALNISHLLHSTRMVEIVAKARREFDVVLIDSPPLILPDARVLGRLSDGVILVLRSGSTNREAALSARERLVEDGTPVLGTILSHFDPTKIAGRTYGHRYYDPANHYGYARHND